MSTFKQEKTFDPRAKQVEENESLIKKISLDKDPEIATDDQHIG